MVVGEAMPQSALHHLQEPLNYMRSNGAALLVAAGEAVDHHQQMQQQNTGKGRSQFYCDQCNMVFGSKSAHTSHMKSHLKYAATTTTAAMAANASATGNGIVDVQGNFSGAPSPPLPTGATNGGDPYQCDKCNKTFAVPARLVSRTTARRRKKGSGITTSFGWEVVLMLLGCGRAEASSRGSLFSNSLEESGKGPRGKRGI